MHVLRVKIASFLMQELDHLDSSRLRRGMEAVLLSSVYKVRCGAGL
jgi:hypothetical protein